MNELTNTYKPRVCFTVQMMKQANTEAGRFWFSPATLKFFGSRISNYLLHNEQGDTYFISSENNFDSTARFFTLRKMDYQTAEIHTISEFQEYKTLAAAKKALRFVAGKPQ